MKTFKQFLKESEHLASFPVRQLTNEEVKHVEDVKKVFAIMHEMAKHKDPSVSDIENYIKKLEPFQHFEFIKKEFHRIVDLISQHGKMQNSKAVLDKHSESLKKHADTLMDELMNGMHASEKAEFSHSEIKSIIASIDHYVDAPNEFSGFVKTHFLRRPSFFGTTHLIDSIGSDDYEKIEKIDTSKPIYTSIEFPKVEEFDYVMYWLQQLQDHSGNKVFEKSHTYSFRIHSKVANINNKDYDELLKLTNKYIHSNDKSLIPKILDLIEKVPSVKQANEVRKKEIKKVYRGLGFSSEDNFSEEEILDKEHKLKYVATSDLRGSAKNFALQKGHLEHEDRRRSEVGYIIHYKVTPESVILDTQVIDTAFGESEIIIDATKAEVEKFEEI